MLQKAFKRDAKNEKVSKITSGDFFIMRHFIG